MNDQDIVQHISELADEERELERAHAGRPPTEDETDRLHAIEVSLDQCWDLLRQRRARRHAGLDPDEAVTRPEDMVEGYEQ